MGVAAGRGTGRWQAQHKIVTLPSRDSLVEPQRLAACPIPLGGSMPTISAPPAKMQIRPCPPLTCSLLTVAAKSGV